MFFTDRNCLFTGHLVWQTLINKLSIASTKLRYARVWFVCKGSWLLPSAMSKYRSINGIWHIWFLSWWSSLSPVGVSRKEHQWEYFWGLLGWFSNTISTFIFNYIMKNTSPKIIFVPSNNYTIKCGNSL